MLIHELTLRGLLSFGPDTPPLEMRPLNVLIGPNGSGKSNYLAAIDLLRSSATKLTRPMRGVGGGGVTEWIWKGAPSGAAHINAVIDNPDSGQAIRHIVGFENASAQFRLVAESIEDVPAEPTEQEPFFYYRFENGRPLVAKRNRRLEKLRPNPSLEESILSQLKDPHQYPEFASLADSYSQCRLYRDWPFGRSAIFRTPQPADLPRDGLEEDYSNLGQFLNHLRGQPSAKKAIITKLRDLYDGLEDFDVKVVGGTVEVILHEHDFIIPANRLSDGTLRYLCLLAILLDPDPPPLICIEEPELGLHPDILPKIADLLVDAAQRTQLVVTTHSDILVDALTERPESVVVVEKHNGQTEARRLEGKKLTAFLEKYRLGEFWIRGGLGGTRW